MLLSWLDFNCLCVAARVWASWCRSISKACVVNISESSPKRRYATCVLLVWKDHYYGCWCLCPLFSIFNLTLTLHEGGVGKMQKKKERKLVREEGREGGGWGLNLGKRKSWQTLLERSTFKTGFFFFFLLPYGKLRALQWLLILPLLWVENTMYLICIIIFYYS